MDYRSSLEDTGFPSALEAVLSGQYELVVARFPMERASYPLPGENLEQSYIRNAIFGDDDLDENGFISVKITAKEARQIKSHKCVKCGRKGSLFHYHTRRFPVRPPSTRS